jgi:4-hydroxybenzoate polyprenyltransferase
VGVQRAGRAALWLLHYWWPLGVGWSFVLVVQRATARSADPYGLAALLFGIASAYSLDRVLDPSDRMTHPRITWLLAATGCCAAVACGLAAWRLPLRTAMLVPMLGIASVLYPRLKRLPALKSAVLPTVWIWAVIALAFNDGSWLGWHAVLQPVAVPLLLLNAAGCLLCDLKDEASDRRDGVRSVPALFGGAATLRLAIGLALASAGLALIEHRTGVVLSAAAMGAATMRPALISTDAVGPLVIDAILTLPGLLISARVV